ncbi:MAG TPA: hypothetical protein VGX68_07615 [Thermoanaerobaculia bacterium]|jgi:tetratricopeptide (TPR) repeat protein|nr:hypothetical protein [Thermoanaerobaculia bacterium]
MESPEVKTPNTELRRLLQAGSYDKALEELRGIEERRSLSPHELVLKGRCLQIGSGSTSELQEAEQAFREALTIDQDYAPALLELAWFLHAVEDDSTKALPLFERALEITKRQLIEAARGKYECLEELQSQEASDNFLQRLRRELASTAVTHAEEQSTREP